MSLQKLKFRIYNNYLLNSFNLFLLKLYLFFDQYKIYISKVLDYLEAKDLYFKLEKYKFYKKEVNFLGFIIRRNGIRINPEKLRVVEDQKELIIVKGI